MKIRIGPQFHVIRFMSLLKTVNCPLTTPTVSAGDPKTQVLWQRNGRRMRNRSKTPEPRHKKSGNYYIFISKKRANCVRSVCSKPVSVKFHLCRRQRFPHTMAISPELGYHSGARWSGAAFVYAPLFTPAVETPLICRTIYFFWISSFNEQDQRR